MPEVDTLTAMRELDGRHVEVDGIGRAYLALEWDQSRRGDRLYLVLYGVDEEICRCRVELEDARDAVHHPFVYLADQLPVT